jgi:membrane protease YdiL (CAAX protease family)
MSVRNLVSDKPPLISLLLIVAIILLGLFIGPFIGLAIAAPFYEGNLLEDLQNQKFDTSMTIALLITQGIGTLIALIVLPVIQLVAIEHKRIAAFFPSQPKTGYILLLLTMLGITFMVSISPIVEWNVSWKFPEFLKGFEAMAREKEDAAAKLTQIMTSFSSTGELMFGLIVIALLPAIGEELVFRGLAQNEFFRATNNIHVAIWTSAIIFSAIHFQFYGFVPRLLLGALFGYLYYWSGNLLIPMFAHFFNNAFGVTMIYLFRQKMIDVNPEDNTAFPLQYVLINLLLTGGLLYYIQKHYKELPVQSSDSHNY